MLNRTHRWSLLVLLLWISLSSAAQAQQRPTQVLRGGRVLDVSTGRLGRPCQLWLAGERILGQRPLEQEIPEGAEVFDVSGCTLMPGLFDMHVHVSAPGGDMSAPLALEAEEQLETQLYFGVTHVVDLHGDQRSIFKLRERTRQAPHMARLYAAGAAFTAPGGHGTQFNMEANSVTSVAEVDQRFEALKELQPDVIKAILEHGDWGAVPELPTLSPELFGAVAQRAKAASLPLFAHIFSADEARTAVRGGADALVHGIFLGELDQPLVEAMLEREVGYIPTLSVVIGSRRASGEYSPYDRESVRAALHPSLVHAVADGNGTSWSVGGELADREEDFFATLKRLSDAGVLSGTGTDAGNPMTPHGPALIHELELYVEAGLSNAEALRAATLNSARLLGVQRDFGELSVGKVADILVVQGNPLEDLEALWRLRDVFKAGQRVDRSPLEARNAKRRSPALVRRAGAELPELIDEFEDAQAGSAWGGRWLALTDQGFSGNSTAALEFDQGIARLKGHIRKGFPYGAWSAMGIAWHPQAKLLVDASEFTGIALRARGSARDYGISLQRAAVKDQNIFAARLPVQEEWSVIEVPFASFRQIGFGRPVPWAAGDLTGILLEARNVRPEAAVHAPFELEVDWIRLY